MLGRGETVGVFQVEGSGMRKALVDMRADRFEDLIALVALYRPGPMANIPVYCERKLGKDEGGKEHWYPHAKLEPILRETFGIIVYQEQVMEVAKLLAGYSLGEADLLRRAMGKKIKAEMDAQRERFVSGAVERGLSKAQASEIFDLLAKFADYGFNKSHAAAYALIAYQTAYLKANFPVEFLAASMTLSLDNTDKLGEFRREAQRLGIRVEPPSVNRSGTDFDVHDGAIRYALAAVKGVGREAVEGADRGARRNAFRRPRRPRPAHEPAAHQQAHAREPRRGGRARRARARPRPRQRRRRRHDGDRPALARDRRRRHGRHVRRRRRGRGRAAHPALRAVAGLGAAAEGIRRRRLLPVRPSARRVRRRCSSGCGCRNGSISAAP